jgi:hypothetical protein
MRFSGISRVRPALLASLISFALSLLAAATALADGGGTSFP